MAADHSTVIRPASDDTITLEGLLSEEFTDPQFGDEVYVYTSAGHVLRFHLEADGWAVRVVADPELPGHTTLDVVRSPGADDYVRVAWPLDWGVATTTAPVTRS